MSNETKAFRQSSSAERRAELLKKLHPLEMDLRYQIGLLGLVMFAVVPVDMFPRNLGGYTELLFLGMFAMSWDVVSGYTGQLSFGHAFFIAVGGYASAILNLQHQLPLYLSIPLAMVVAGIAGVAVGLPALRLRGPYLSLVTLVVPVILSRLFILFDESLVVFGIPLAPDGLGGRSGPGLPARLVSTGQDALITASQTTLFGKTFTAYQMQVLLKHYLTLAVFVLVLVVLLAVTRSSAGSVFTAIREDEDAVEAAGLNPAKFKLFAFVLSAVVGGLAGALFVHTVAFPQPGRLLGRNAIGMSINLIVMCIIGGTGTVVGGVIGAVFFGSATAFIGSLSFKIPVVGIEVSSLTPLPLLTVAMLTLLFFPGGILRVAIKSGRSVLAYAQGDTDELELGGEDLSDTAIGDVIEKYQDEIDQITGGDDR